MRATCDKHTSREATGCWDCRIRRAAWGHDRAKKIAAGTWRPWSDYVAIELVERHLKKLTAAGMSYRDIARQTKRIDPTERGVSADSIRRLAHGMRGRTRIRTGALILGVRPAPDPPWVSNVGTERRVEAMQWMCWTRRQIFRGALGWGETSCPRRSDGRVTRRTHRAIKEFYEAHSHEWGPSKITGIRARKKGYAPPAAWDDDTMDDPRAKPHGIVRETA